MYNKLTIALFTLSCMFMSLSSAETPTANGKLAQTSGDFRGVAKEAIPAVVSIKVKGVQQQNNSLFGEQGDDSQDMFGDDFWNRFFGLKRRGQSSDQEQISGQASGFIISPDGYVLTNSHVVKDMTDITVVLNDGREFAAKVVGQDPNTDVALVKIDASNLPFLKFGNSDNLEVGQWVVAIGNPLGLQASLTVGVVSAKGRNNLDLTHIEDYIQTDAAINRGNSGGPLLTLNSEVVGMNTAIVTSMATGGYMGIGFSIPSNLLKSVMDDLKESGSFKRGYMGVVLQQVDNDLAQAFGLEKAEGALIAEVSKDSPAEKAGLKQGDIVLKYNNQPVTNIGAFRNAISMMRPGSSITLSILRNGKPQDIKVDLALFPSTEVTAAKASDNKLGVEVENLTADVASKLGYGNDKGVVISKVVPGGLASWAGLKKGALILEVNKKKTTTVDEFNVALKETQQGKPILLLIKQGEVTRYLSLKAG